MRKIFLIGLVVLTTFISCTTKKPGGLTLRGQIKDESKGAKVYLEEVTYSDRSTLDTAELDAQGNFVVQTKLKNLGLYQLRIEDSKGIFFVLDDQPATVTIDADSNSIKNYSYKVNGSSASEQLRQFIVQTKKYGDAFGIALGDYSTSVNDSTPDSIRKVYESKLMVADSNFRVFARGYVDTVKNPIIAMFAVSNMDFKHDRSMFDQLEDKMKANYPQLPFTQAFIAMVDAQKQQDSQNYYQQKFSDDAVVPDIDLNDVYGKPRRLSALRGNYVLLDFWASWCGPCRAENPKVVAAYEKYASKGFTIFSVSLDTDKDKWINAIKKDHLYWPNHVSELKGWESSICEVYGIRAIPQNYLLDKEGKIIAYNIRGDDLDHKLAELLQ